MFLPALLSIIPFVIFIFLLLFRKVNLLFSSLTTLGVVFLLVMFYWQIVPLAALNSVTKGTLIALDILIIIIGSIFFLKIMEDLQIIANVCLYLESFLKDYRVQVILLAWFLENFLEGTAGFGTPATVVAPILISLGLPPLKAVIIALLGNSTSVAFGAAGTPIRVGLAGLDTTLVPGYATFFNLAGILVPVFMLWVLTAEQKERGRHFWEALPFAIWAGLAFTISSVLVVGLGQEFISILGAVLGLIVVLITIRLKILIPTHHLLLHKERDFHLSLPIFKVILPYCLLIIFLIAGKFFLRTTLLSFPWNFQYTFNLFNPGWAFLLAGLVVAVWWKKSKVIIANLKIATQRSFEPFLVIVAMSTLVQLMINSGENFSHLPSSLEIIAKFFEVSFLPLLTPFVGAFGSFLTGSATLSNVMFGNFLAAASQVLNYPVAIILSLALVGGAAGNMIALADVLVAETVVGLKNKTRFVLRGVIVPCLIYLIIVGILGMIAINWF